MKKRLREILLALILLTANAVFAVPEDRFKGGIKAGYDKNSVLDAPVPASYPRIKINGVLYEQIKSINGADPRSIFNDVR